MLIKRRYPSGWRDFQAKLKRDVRRRRFLSSLMPLALYPGGAILILILVFYAGPWISGYLDQRGYVDTLSEKSDEVIRKTISFQDVSFLLKNSDLDCGNLAESFTLEKDGVHYAVKSFLDRDLQGYINNLLRRSRTVRSAVVLLDPNDGRVLAMANHDKEGRAKNFCVKADYPAASLFKIVSAAAAMECAGFTPDRTVFFQGRKHTLYKRQLEQKRGAYTSKTSFRNAFATSINSVFGKLGIYELRRERISEYAEKFLFNRPIPFELEVDGSSIHVPDDDFGLAEIASGFNKETLISPLHAALLVSAVANNGIIMAPRLIESVLTESGKRVYKSRPAVLASPISRGTAKELQSLMRDTVLYGTCRASLRTLRRKKAFADIELGAKTGTINDKTDRFRYEWLAAYALPRNGSRAICVAILSVHGKKLGVKANELGRNIINYYLTS